MKTQEALNNVPMLIILTGESGAGKSTFVNCLDCDGHWYESSRAMVEALQGEGKEITHDTIHEYATQRYTENPLWQVPMILESLKNTNYIIYDGPRRVIEVQELVKTYPAVVIVRITADDRVRLARLRARDGISEEDFQRIKRHESKETQLGQILSMATITIENNGTVEELHEKASDLFKFLNISL